MITAPEINWKSSFATQKRYEELFSLQLQTFTGDQIHSNVTGRELARILHTPTVRYQLDEKDG